MAELGPFELKRYVVEPSKAKQSVRASEEKASGAKDKKDVTIENELVRVTFDSNTGLLKSVANKADGTEVAVSQNFFWYESATTDQKSGAYIFRPNHTSPDGQDIACASADCRATLEVVRSAVVQEVRQVFSAWVAQTVRVYAGRADVELEWTVGPVPHEGDAGKTLHPGKEVISRFSSDIASGDALYTDSNGRDMLLRHRCSTAPNARDKHCRPSVPVYNVTEPVAGNYFPVNTQAMITGPEGAMTVSVDRSQGVASMVAGQLELMVHRRVLEDDNRGVAEPLNETQSISPYDWVDDKKVVHHSPYRIGKGLVVRGKHRLTITSSARAARSYRALQSEIYYEPLIAVVPSSGHAPSRAAFQGLQADLPANVEILTLEKQEDGSVLLRVAHKFGINEDDALAVPVDVPLGALFTVAHLATPIKIKELSLSANQSRKAMLARRRRFMAKDRATAKNRFEHYEEKPRGEDAIITLAPLQIRTFKLFFE